MEGGRTTGIVQKTQQAADKLLPPLGPKEQGQGKIGGSIASIKGLSHLFFFF